MEVICFKSGQPSSSLLPEHLFTSRSLSAHWLQYGFKLDLVFQLNFSDLCSGNVEEGELDMIAESLWHLQN